MKKEFFILDSHAYLYKNYFALPKLLTSHGEEVGAVYGFIRLLLKIIKEKKPQYLAVCYDSPGVTKREEKYSLYKANRPKTDKALIDQINLSWELLSSLGVKTLKASGYEADDIIAVLCEKALAQVLTPVVVSHDKDIYSLISRGALVWDGNSKEYYGEEYALKKFGVPSSLIRDYLSLTGDSSDNIPGAEGIGPKKASLLLNKYGSLEKIISACEGNFELDRDLAKVKKSIDSIRLSWELVGLDYSLPLDFKKEDYAFSGFKTEKVNYWAERLQFQELYTIAGQSAKAEHCSQGELFSADDTPSAACGSISEIILRKPEEFSVASGEIFDTAVIAEAEDSRLVILLESQAKKYLYDAKEIIKKACPEKLENFEDIKLAYYLAHGGQRKPELEKIMRDFFPYADKRPSTVMKEIFISLKNTLDEKKLTAIYEEIEKPLVFCLAEMEKNGMSVDESRLKELSVQLEAEIGDIVSHFKRESGEDINLNSPKQVSSFLYEKLNLPLTEKQKSMFKTKTGYSTSEEALSALEPYSPLITLIIKYRELSKLKSSFADVLLEKISGGRVRTVFDQTGTATGRLSSSNPNLQNIPVKTEHGRLIRACFNSAPGFILVSADYSQIDLRVLAHVSADPKLIEAFEKGEDVHMRTACEIFGLKPEEINTDMRRIAKTVNFGIVYGQSANGLSRELSIPQAEAAKYIEGYFNYYNGVRQWSTRTIEEARKNGYCLNFLGRRRELPNLASPNRTIRSFAERIAMNMPIQSGSSDIIKKAMINIYPLIKGREDIRLCSQVHDELIFEIKEEKIQDWAGLIKREMENSFRLSVPLVVEVKSGSNWAEMKKISF
ncbi:MAG: DNA polymerase I [Elusimicrobiota bacterium]